MHYTKCPVCGHICGTDDQVDVDEYVCPNCDTVFIVL